MLFEQIGEITMVTNPNTGVSFIIDSDDISVVNGRTWGTNSHGYVINYDKKKVVMLHREIMRCPENMVVDHINHNKTDNRKKNLRICTVAENAYNARTPTNNTSGQKGVSFSMRDNMWVAYISFGGKLIQLGRFKSKDDAVRNRINAEVKYHGDFRYAGTEVR